MPTEWKVKTDNVAALIRDENILSASWQMAVIKVINLIVLQDIKHKLALVINS